jgi:hypothetical protein
VEGVEQVRFWSSNVPDGYGEKVIPRSKIVRALFSRLDRPAMINRVANLPPVDEFLAGMLKRSATQEAGEGVLQSGGVRGSAFAPPFKSSRIRRFRTFAKSKRIVAT